MAFSWNEPGDWWLPLNPQQHASGLLRFDSNKGLKLSDVGGGWLAELAAGGGIPAAPQIILGRGRSASLYTCVGNYYLSVTHAVAVGGGQVVTAEINVQTVLKGRHFDPAEAVVFRRFSCAYSNLHSWLDSVPAFDFQTVAEQERTYRVRHTRDLLWQTPVVGGFMVSNNYSFNHRVAFRPDPEISFRHVDGVLITSDEPRPVADLLRAEHAFRSLINLLGDCRLEVQTIRANEAAAGGPRDVECYDARVAAAFATREDAKVGIAPVSYADLGAEFAGILQRWFELYDRLGPIANLYLIGKQTRYLDLQNIFLGLIQGLERYHRSFHDEARNAALLAQTVDTRNCIVHQLETGEMNVLSGAALYNAVNVWRETLLALILQRLGVAMPTVDVAVRRLQAQRGVFVAM